jgi:hypothetical protein
MSILYIRDELNERWLPCVENVGSIPNVNILDTVEDGHGLFYENNSGSPRWTSGSVGGGSASYLDDLLDVDLTSPSQGHILVYNQSTSKWENVAQSGSAGDMYKSTYDTTDNGVVDNSEKLGGELPSY